MPYEEMHAFVDESDRMSTGGPLVITVWLTAYWDMWSNIVEQERRKNNYWYEMHYHKISRNSSDRRANLTLALARQLQKVRYSWYARAICIKPELKSLWEDRWNQEQAHEAFLFELADQFFGHARTKKLNVYVDAKRTHGFDVALLQEITEQLNSVDGPRVEMKAVSSKQSEGLQLADMLAGAIGWNIAPGENPNKQAVADVVHALMDADRIRVWHWP